MKLKKLSATFRDPEHGEKARPLGPEVKKRGTTQARDDYSAYLLSNQKANAQPLDEDDPITSVDPPPPVPEGGPDEPPQLPPAYIQAVDAFENAIALQGGNMDASGDGQLDVLDVSGIIDFFMTLVGQSISSGSAANNIQPNNLFWNSLGQQYSNDFGEGLFFSEGVSFNGNDPVYYAPSDSGIPESLLTWADYMESQESAGYPIILDWFQQQNPNQAASALTAVFDAYQGDVPEDFFDTLLMNPQPTEADLEDLGAWFDNNMLPIMNIYADVFMYNATGGDNTLGYNGGNNFQEMMDYIESTGGGLGYFDVSINDTDYNPFSENLFDVNNDGVFNGADIAAWADFTEMISVVTSGESISAENNVFSQEDIDQIVAYYNYYGIEMAGGNLFFSTNGEWIDTQNVANINNVAENPPIIFNLLDSGDVETYQDEIAAAEQEALLQQGWVNSRPVWGEAFGLSADLQSETPEWYIAFANAIQPWLDLGYDPGFQLGASNISSGNNWSFQVTGYNDMLSTWVGQNLFDPDNDGQWNPDELTAEANLVLNWLSNNPFITEAQTPEAFAALELENLIGNLIADNTDWVASVGGLPPWANIIGQEAGEAFNYNAQVGALVMLASNFGNQVDTGTVQPGLYGNFPQDFFTYLGYDPTQSAELADYFNTGGIAADQEAFSTWLQLGFNGIGVTYENADGNIAVGNTGQGILWSPFGWDGDFNSLTSYLQVGNIGPSGNGGIQFYNFNLDITSEGFLYGYVSPNNPDPFYPPPVLPTQSTPPVTLVTPGLLFGDSSLDSTDTGMYMDIQNFVDRTGGFIDFANDGQIGLADWFALHTYVYSNINANYAQYLGGFAWGQYFLTPAGQLGTQGAFGDSSDYLWMSNATDLYLDNHPLWGSSYISTANSQANDDSAYFNSSWNDGAYTFNPYAPEVALANFLIFQYVNDYVSNDGAAPNWYAELTLIGYADGNAMFNAIDPNWQSYDDLTWNWNGPAEAGYFTTVVLPYLQAAMPAYEDLQEYAQYYLDSGIDINEVFVGLGGETTSIFTSSGELGIGEGGSLAEVLQTVGEQNYWIGFVATNPGLLSALASIGDGNGNSISSSRASQYQALLNAISALGDGVIESGVGTIDFLALSYWLEANGSSPAYSGLNQMLDGLGYQGAPTATAYVNAIYALMQPFVDAGFFTATVGTSTFGPSGEIPEFGYTLTFTGTPWLSDGGSGASLSPSSWLNQYQQFLGDIVIDGILGTAVLGGGNNLYLNEEGVVTPIGEGGFGSGLYESQVNADPAAYAQVIELINQFGDIDFNGDGVYNEADVQYLLNLVGNTEGGSAQEIALDLNDDGIFNDEDVLLFTSFFGGSGDFSFGQFGYYDIPEGESVDEQYWVDFDFDSYTNGYYGYNAVSETPPPPPAP